MKQSVRSISKRSARASLVALAALASLVVAAPASAAPTWLAPTTISTPSPISAFPTDIAVTADGTVVAAWGRYNDCNPTCVVFAEVAVRPPGGSFLPAQTLSGSNSASEIQVAAAPDGSVYAVWSEYNGANYIIRSAVMAPGATSFGPGQDVSGSGQNAFNPEIAIGGNNTAIATWVRAGLVQAAVKPAGSTFFGSASDLSATGASQPTVVMDSAGNAVVAWQMATQILAAARPAGGSFTALAPVFTVADTTNDHLHEPHLAMDSLGRTTIAWSYYQNSISKHVIKSMTRGTSGNFGGIDDVSDPTVDSGSSGYMDLAVSQDNNAILVWSASSTGTQASARPSGGAFGAIQNISAPGSFTGNPAVRFDAAGTATAVWQGSSSGTGAIQSASRPKGGSFGDVTDIELATATTFVNGPTPLDLDPEGNAATTWLQYDCPSSCSLRIRAAGFDGAAPKLSNVSIPSTGVATKATGMSVSASDTWSAFNVSWNFGDGGTGSGGSVSHTYAAPGTYTVSVTATDAVGNSRSTQQNIVVASNDADGDGSPAGPDCNDGNSAIHPGATDVPGNGIDEDCANGDAKKRVSARVSYVYLWFGARTAFSQLDVAKVPKGSTVRLKCKGSSCPRKLKKIAIKKATKKLKLAKYLFKKKKPARLKTGTVVTVFVSHPEQIGISTRLTVGKKRKAPKRRDGCVAVGSTKKTACP